MLGQFIRMYLYHVPLKSPLKAEFQGKGIHVLVHHTHVTPNVWMRRETEKSSHLKGKKLRSQLQDDDDTWDQWFWFARPNATIEHPLAYVSGLSYLNCSTPSMRLINVKTRHLEEFVGQDIPRYAILSHTWDVGQEVTFEDFQSTAGAGAAAPGAGQTSHPSPESAAAATKKKTGWRKIDLACRQAERDLLSYAWVDTCCIDKSSSAELSEAINSMFQWYHRAKVCYVYLSDLAPHPATAERTLGLEPPTLEAGFRHCRWFRRSWTLQELIAPGRVDFYDMGWTLRCTKAEAAETLARITGVDVDVLRAAGRPGAAGRAVLDAASVAQKMSWAAGRQSTRIEDVAYSLLGLFGINMPLLYGEEEKAFLRLQAEIVSSCPDTTILAWGLPASQERPDEIEETSGMGRDQEVESRIPAFLSSFSGVMASSPQLFRACGQTRRLLHQSSFDFSMSNRGIKLRAQFGLRRSQTSRGSYLVFPVCRIQGVNYGILVRNAGGGCFVRQQPGELVRVHPIGMGHRLMLDPFLLTKLPPVSGTEGEERGTGRNMILQSRRRVLEIVLAPGMEIYRRWPWQQWDDLDMLFFESQPPTGEASWAALKIVALAPPSDMNGPKSVDFLFYAFGWNWPPSKPGAEPRCAVQQVSGTVGDRAIEQMNDEAVRDSWNAYRVGQRLVRDGVPERSFVLVGTSAEHALLITSTVRVVEQETGERHFWRVNFDWQVVHRDSLRARSNRRWENMNWGPMWLPPWLKRANL